jgi:hypothetical protein
VLVSPRAPRRRGVSRSTPSQTGGHGDHAGIEVEQERGERGVDALERGEVRGGLHGVRDAEQEADGAERVESRRRGVLRTARPLPREERREVRERRTSAHMRAAASVKRTARSVTVPVPEA